MNDWVKNKLIQWNLEKLLDVFEYPRVEVAIKIIDTGKVREPYVIKNLTREARLLAKLQHPSIVYLYETIRCHSSYYLVTELATGGDLYTHIRKQPAGHLDVTTAKCYARQLVSALNHIHLQGIVHRDLKMENIMLKDSRKKHIKIIDFGLSNWSTGENRLETHCGSPEYAAPELFLVGQKYGPEVDFWSLGVILYGMTTGQLPFSRPRNDKTCPDVWRRKLMAQIFRGLTTLQEKKIATISNDYKNLVRRLLEPVAHRRIPMWEICRHPWLNDKNKKISVNINIFPSKETVKSISQEIHTATGLDELTIDEKIRLEPYGEIGGIFNIKAHKLLGTGSADVFEATTSSITQKIRASNNTTIPVSPMAQSHPRETSSREFSSSLARTTNFSRSRPSVLGVSILPRDGSYARLQRWMDNKKKPYSQQRNSAPDVGTCTRRIDKNIADTRVNRIGRIAMPLISTNWRNFRSRNMGKGEEISELHGDQMFGKSTIDRYETQMCRQNRQASSSKILQTTKTVSRPSLNADVKRPEEHKKHYPLLSRLEVNK